MPEKPLHIVRHARNRMRRDRISEDDVALCIDEADSVRDSIFGRKNYWKRLGGGFLRVTIADEGARLVVISAVIKVKMSRGETA